ncbi:hypothetical protein [Microbacterium sp. NPDC089696]|uniref:hypothetical protein n=1 Tax=Microbacterium sp. NPDC089696 TaxID=3364199 RepID=UPI0037FE0055
MNVEREIDAANRRVQAQIDASARAALIRIGVDPDEVAREEAEARMQAARDVLAAWGYAVGEWVAMFAQLVEAFERAFAEAGR